MSQNKPRLVACPSCKNLSEYSTENPYRPFCCQRCKMIDLGAWASEDYKITDKQPSEEIESPFEGD